MDQRKVANLIMKLNEVLEDKSRILDISNLKSDGSGAKIIAKPKKTTKTLSSEHPTITNNYEAYEIFLKLISEDKNIHSDDVKKNIDSFYAVKNKIFTSADLLLTENTGKMKYQETGDWIKKNLHWGQRKLFLSEVEFFSIFWKPREIPNPLCVYAGAAPGKHIPLLSEMFPNIEFHLYDPAHFAIQNSNKIKIFNKYFTDDVAKKYSNKNNIFFICDIRTSDFEGQKKKLIAKNELLKDEEIELAAREENESQIFGDMRMQEQWVLIMNPEHCLLKFRLPYPNLTNKSSITYLFGKVFFQIWAPGRSNETRLKPTRNENGQYFQINWNIIEYDERCYYFSKVIREEYQYQNFFTENNEPLDDPELLNDYDSTAEAFIFKLYFNLILNDNFDIYNKVKQISKNSYGSN